MNSCFWCNACAGPCSFGGGTAEKKYKFNTTCQVCRKDDFPTQHTRLTPRIVGTSYGWYGHLLITQRVLLQIFARTLSPFNSVASSRARLSCRDRPAAILGWSGIRPDRDGVRASAIDTNFFVALSTLFGSVRDDTASTP